MPIHVTAGVDDESETGAPRPFLLELYPRPVDSGELEKRIPPHRLVAEPLLREAVELSVHGRGRGTGVRVPPGIRRGDALYLDLATEVLRGWESFWNASAWERGAILIKVKKSQIDWAEVFSWTQYGGQWASRRQLTKSTPESAIRYADTEARGEFVVLSLSASNGIQWAAVWSDPAECDELNELAKSRCRHFVRWAESGKFEREIVYDRDSYMGLV